MGVNMTLLCQYETFFMHCTSAQGVSPLAFTDSMGFFFRSDISDSESNLPKIVYRFVPFYASSFLNLCEFTNCVKIKFPSKLQIFAEFLNWHTFMNNDHSDSH